MWQYQFYRREDNTLNFILTCFNCQLLMSFLYLITELHIMCSETGFLYLSQGTLYHIQAAYMQLSICMVWALLLRSEI